MNKPIENHFVFANHEPLPVIVKGATIHFTQPEPTMVTGRLFRVGYPEKLKHELALEQEIKTLALMGDGLADGSGREEVALMKKGHSSASRDLLWPMLVSEGSLYSKDSEGGGGHNISRFFIRKGKLFIETSNKKLDFLLKNSNYAKRTGRENDSFIQKLVAYGLWRRNAMSRSDYRQNRRLKKTRVYLGEVNDEETIEAFANAVKQINAANSFETSLPTLYQSEIRQLKLGRKPLEIRFFVQKTPKGYQVVHHYAKIGGTNFTSNYSQGGKLEKTLPALTKAFSQRYPGLTRPRILGLARQFINDAGKNAVSQLDSLDQKVQLKQTGYGIKVTAPPILSTVDAVAVAGEQGPKPVLMEVHASGDFAMAEDAMNGMISTSTWKRMVARHSQNMEEIIRESKKAAAKL